MELLERTELNQNRKRTNRTVYLVLGGLWLAGTVIRFFIALASSISPSIMPDEGLYLQLSRSLAEDGAVLLRGQPVHYIYLLYPLILAPLHWLPAGINIYRAIQLTNAALMHLAVFPAFGIAKRLTGKKNTALFVALIAVLLPDMAMINRIMTEPLLYPLILTALYVALRLFETPEDKRMAVLFGLLNFCLYAVKPGLVVIGGVYMLITLWRSWRDRDMPRLVQCGRTAAGFFIPLLLYYALVYGVFGVNRAQSSLYASQTAKLTWTHIKQTMAGLLIYFTYVPAAFLYFPVLIPWANRTLFPREKRQFLLLVLGAVVLLVLGTVYVFYVDELGSDPYSARVHVRYVAAFFPVLLACFFAPEMREAKMTPGMYAAGAFCIAGLFALQWYPLISGRSFPVDALMLSHLLYDDTYINSRIFTLVIYSALLVWLAVRIRQNGLTKRLQSGLAVGTAALFLFITPFGYALNEHNMDERYPADAAEARAITGADSILVILDEQYFWQPSSAFDVAYRGGQPVLELDDIIRNTQNNGVLSSFVPKGYWMSEGVHAIDIPTHLVLTNEVMNRIALSSHVKTKATSNLLYMTAVLPEDGLPWVHSALHGFEQGWITENSAFTVFDYALCNAESILSQFNVYTEKEGTVLYLTYGETVYSYTLSSGLQWIELNQPVEDASVPFRISFSAEANVYVGTYLVLAGETAEP